MTLEERNKHHTISMKGMCEFIASMELLEDKKTKQPLTPEEIFNYSPTGEVYMIYEWYAEAIGLALEKEAFLKEFIKGLDVKKS